MQFVCERIILQLVWRATEIFETLTNTNKLMASQEKCEEYKSCYFWLRGHHAYKDKFQPEIDTTLVLQRGPENAKDPLAVAIT